jgi:hypothetical protein
MKTIIVFDVIGKNAISMQNGDKIYNLLHTDLINEQKITLDFEQINLFASPFFNASIGLLLKDISIEQLQQNLTFDNLNEVGNDLLNHVISNAIAYYGNSDNVTKGINSVSDEDKGSA